MIFRKKRATPRGVLNASNILTDVWTGSPATFQWDDVLELERELLAAKSNRGNIATIMDATTYKGAKGRTKVSSDAGAGFILENNMMNGYPVYATTNCPANTIIHGNWEDLVIATWGALAIASDPYTNFASGSVRIRAMMPLDIGVGHASSFCKSTPS